MRDEAYIMCCEVLSHLNEKIPDSVDLRKVTAMVKETGETLRNISEKELLEMKIMDSVLLHYTLKFYVLLVSSGTLSQISISTFF